MENIRSFIAVELPADLKQALAELQLKFKSAGSPPVRWVEPKNIHLTLKFLGDIDAGDTGKITAALEEAVRGVSPFYIEASGLGVFPNLNRIQIIWIGLYGDIEKLGNLQKRIETNLKPLGFPAEGRPFTPHLTLARVRDYATGDARQKLGQLISGTSFTEKYKIGINAVNLMKSQLTREGPIYTKLTAITLK
ncbi:MAG: RNA 2',3'-cyclic phosphodiesterase [Dehalococcoidales bacterium]